MFRRLQSFLPYIFTALLLVWGTYVTLTFIGTDGHIVVLLKGDDWQRIGTEVSSPFLRGLKSLIPFATYLATRLSPFIGYAVLSLLLYGGYVAYVVFGKGRLFLKVSLSAVHILLLGILSLWLISTTLFYSSFPNLEPRLLIEPNEEVYKGVPGETLAALKSNFEHLNESGCLSQDTTRYGAGNARVFWYRGHCVQLAFFARVLAPLLMLLFFIFDFLVLGSVFLSLLRLKPSNRAVEFLVALSMGTVLFITTLWLLAAINLLTGPIVWGILALIPIAGYRFSLAWLRGAWKDRFEVQTPFHSATILLFWLLLSLIAFNFFTVVRPFPIGWDDLGRYINLPRQLSVTNQILPGIPAIQWEYLTSLGFLLFGYFSTFGAILAQQINWMAGLFAILAVYLAAKMVLGPRAGLLAAFFYYLLPMTGHFSFADMKTENALLFFGAVGIVCILLFAFEDLAWGKEERSRNVRWMIPAGILLAAAFATKPTMVLMVLMGGIILTFALLPRAAGIGSILLSLVVLMIGERFSLGTILQKVWGIYPPWLDLVSFIVFTILGVLLYLLPLLQKKSTKATLHSLRSYGIAVSLLVVSFAAFSLPWMGRNMILNGKASIGEAMKAPNTVTPWVRYSPEEIPSNAPPGSRSLPPELMVDRSSEMCQSTATSEELDRYWGYGSGPMHYLGLPWRVVMNKDSQGYYLTTSPLLLLVPLLLLLPIFWQRRVFRILFVGTIFYAAVWVIVANGIPWYGIGMFLGLAIMVEAFIVFAPNPVAKILAGLLITLALATNVSLRLWQFSMQYNLYEFGWGKASHEVLSEMTIPDYDDITERVLELSKNPDRPYLYRMGTFISYFIPGNREIMVVNDNQLEFFNCLNQEKDHALTLKRLQALGFHSIVFDTNTATIEKDPNGTLHQKVQRFLDFANDASLGITPVVNNPGNGIAYMVLPSTTEAGTGSTVTTETVQE